MEIEFKYLIPDESIVEKFWQEAVFKKYGDVDSRQSVQMRAAYYDTPDGILSSVDAAFRIRHEGPHVVATIKWGGRQKEGLHEREELNIQLADSFDDSMASLDVFAESEKGRELIELIGDRPLQKKLETDFLRRIRRIDTGKANLVQLFGGIFPHVDGLTIDDGDHFTGVGGDGAVADGGADEDEEDEGDDY